jgi:hypothetical protein
MSAKKQRVSYLIGIHTALAKAECSVTDMNDGVYCYKQDKIKQVLATLRALLKADGITDGNE